VYKRTYGARDITCREKVGRSHDADSSRVSDSACAVRGRGATQRVSSELEKRPAESLMKGSALRAAREGRGRKGQILPLKDGSLPLFLAGGEAISRARRRDNGATDIGDSPIRGSRILRSPLEASSGRLRARALHRESNRRYWGAAAQYRKYRGGHLPRALEHKGRIVLPDARRSARECEAVPRRKSYSAVLAELSFVPPSPEPGLRAAKSQRSTKDDGELLKGRDRMRRSARPGERRKGLA